MLLSIFALTSIAMSKLVVYGPQELIDKFNTETRPEDASAKSK